jgi:Protein of unknown function (DUF3570)
VILLVGALLAVTPASPTLPPPPDPSLTPAPPPFQIESFRVRFSYFDQNGLGYQSAAGPAGGPGSERTTVEQPQVEVVATLGDRVTQRLWVPIDVITAASPDHSRYGKPIDAPDAITTASAINEAGTLETQTDYRWRRDRDAFFLAGFHKEEPFESWSIGAGVTGTFLDDNVMLGANVNQIIDWFDRFDLEGHRHGRASRSTSNANVTYSQVLSTTTVAVLSYGATLQLGTLGNTWQSVLQSDGTRGVEILPRRRQRHAVTARLAHWLPWNGALKLYLRDYLDDWGIEALSGQADLAQRLTPSIYVQASYRIHRQTGASFFTIDADPNTTTLRTSDSDLAAFYAQTIGGLVAVDLPGAAWPRFLSGATDVHVDLGYERYSRSNDLWVNIGTCGFGFQF